MSWLDKILLTKAQKVIKRAVSNSDHLFRVKEKPIIQKLLRHCINAVLVILLVSILFKVNIVINVENLGKLIVMGIICSWFDEEVFK